MEEEGHIGNWVREATADAAPLPLPKKLSPQHLLSQPNSLGSVWNTAGTWEKKNLNNWATHRIKELLVSVGSLEFSGGKAQIAKVSKCSGDAFLVIVRNKKRVGYTYELTLKIKGEWIVKEEKRMVKGHLDFPEFSFGELDDLQMQVRLSDEKDLSRQDMLQISQNLKLFLQPVREKLLQFEQELKDSYGVVLMEMLTGLRAIDKNRPPGQQDLREWALPFLSDRSRLRHIMDPRLQGKYGTKQASEIAVLAVRCVKANPTFRPSMKEVAETLDRLKLQK